MIHVGDIMSTMEGVQYRGGIQSQKTQGFCVADFATLSDETRSYLKIFPLFIWIKELCVRKFEGLERSKLLGISQTILKDQRIVSSTVLDTYHDTETPTSLTHTIQGAFGSQK